MKELKKIPIEGALDNKHNSLNFNWSEDQR